MAARPEEFDATIEAFLCKPLPYRLRLAVSVFKVFENDVRAALVGCKFERCAYLGARKDAIRQGLVIGEEEQWVGDRDGPLQPFRLQKPDGTVESVQIPLLASGRALREAESRLARVLSQITTTVREVWGRYPDLIESNSPLACVCANECQWKKDVPEWAKPPIQVPKEWDDEHAGCSRLEFGDRAVQTYWPALEMELIKLAAAIEKREGDNDGGSAMVDDEARLAPADLAAHFAVPKDALRQRLDGWRKKHDEGWYEVTERKPREAKYIYRVGSVRHIIEQMLATSQTTSD